MIWCIILWQKASPAETELESTSGLSSSYKAYPPDLVQSCLPCKDPTSKYHYHLDVGIVFVPHELLGDTLNLGDTQYVPPINLPFIHQSQRHPPCFLAINQSPLFLAVEWSPISLP